MYPPPPGPGYPPQNPYAPPGPGYPPNPYAPPGYYGAPPQEENSNAKLSMILSLCGLLCGVCAIAGLIVGLKAQAEMRMFPGRYSNASQAQIGVIVGGILCGITALGVVAALVGNLSGL
jgi:hypothetical protein